MRFLTRVLTHGNWIAIAIDVFTISILALLALGEYLIGKYALAAGLAAATSFFAYLCFVQVRAYWRNRAANKLCNQLRREFKRRLAGAELICLVVAAEKTALVIRRHTFFLGTHYQVTVATLDDDTEQDWNLAFSQSAGLVRGETFAFPSAVTYAERDIWLVRGDDDSEENPHRGMSLGSLRRRVRHLNMDAIIAGEAELQALLYMLHGSVPLRSPDETE